MKRYIQHDYLKISHFAAAEWQHPVHNHNHFEIIFVHKGKGSHCLSGMHYPYNGKTLFLLAPCDFHRFDIQELTEFTFLKFTNVYLKGVGNFNAQEWNKEMDQLLVLAANNKSPIIKTEKEAGKFDRLFRLIGEEWKETKNENNEAVFFLIQSLLAMIKRITQYRADSRPQKHSEKINAVLNYIHEHIYSTEETQAERLAEMFDVSKHYIGEYFKEQTGTTLREYVNVSRLHLIENRLLYSSLSLKEIGYEFGFSDASHLNKFFKTHKGMNPSVFRNTKVAERI